jgi:hypothetical protein
MSDLAGALGDVSGAPASEVGRCLGAQFRLDFHDASQTPTERGAYLLYNQCDGYHLADFWDGKGEQWEIDPGFRFWASADIVTPDFYCAWAKLPDTVSTMYHLFARTRSHSDAAD